MTPNANGRSIAEATHTPAGASQPARAASHGEKDAFALPLGATPRLRLVDENDDEIAVTPQMIDGMMLVGMVVEVAQLREQMQRLAKKVAYLEGAQTV